MSTQRDAQKIVTEITTYLKQTLPADATIGARLKFVYPGAGVIMIDGRTIPNVVSNRDEAADCTVEIDPAVHFKLLHGEMDQGLAFRQGKMRISGDVAIAVRLGPALRDSNVPDRT
jgi:putative sterol carrier protein